MGKMQAQNKTSHNFSYDIKDPQSTVNMYFENANIKFKNARETSVPLKNRTISNALTYLNDVSKYKRCIPITRFGKKCGRTAQAKEFGTDKGRWPQASVKYFKEVLEKLKQEAEKKDLDGNNLKIVHINVNQAPKVWGRKFSAFGRTKSIRRKPCHIEIVAIKEELITQDEN